MNSQSPHRAPNRRDWSKTVCIVCDKTGGMELDSSHRSIIVGVIRDAQMTVKSPGAPAIHFKCEEQLKRLARAKKGKSL